MSATGALRVGQSIGNYVIRSVLGEGGMGMVYLAEHPLLGRRVAVKVLHPEVAARADAFSRFVTEAQAVNKIGHPNIVDITDFGQTAENDSYFVMEYLAGESLSGRIKRAKKMQVADALHVTMQVADALAASHAAGILHRDLKPDNIHLIQRGTDPQFVKVLDFGLAKLTASTDQVSHRTRTGSVMGTPYYMAPEQCAGKADIDARADVYALGVILFEMLTGEAPFTGEGYGEVIVKHMTQPPPTVAELRSDVPAWLDQLVARMLEKERRARVQSMAELNATIRSCLEGAPLPTAPQVTRPSLFDASPHPRRGRMVAVVAGIAVAAGTAVAAIVALRKDRPAVVADAADAAPRVAVAAPADAAPVAAPTPPPIAQQRPPQPVKVTIHLESDPPGATVVADDGAEVGTTPVDWTVERAERDAEITFKKDGYDPRKRTISLRADSNFVVDLPRARSKPRPQPTPQPQPVAKPPEPVAKPPEPTKPPPRPKPDDDLMAPPGN